MTQQKCPLTYQPLLDGQSFSPEGLRQLDRRLTKLHPLPFDTQGLRRQALALADKLSIQGVQFKLSAKLDVRAGSFTVAERGGTFILKPPSVDYPELPANEDVTMYMASSIGIDVPLHGLVPAQDGQWVYFIRRFDRLSRGKKKSVEDFAQLMGRDREAKYSGSLEAVIQVVNERCTFPVVERVELFKRVLFCFLTGNEDMHLKNFSLVTHQGKTSLAPAYDYLNTTIALPSPKEELALSLRGRKNRLRADDFFLYLGRERMNLNASIIESTWATCQAALPTWIDWIRKSFLSSPMRDAYATLLQARMARLQS